MRALSQNIQMKRFRLSGLQASYYKEFRKSLKVT